MQIVAFPNLSYVLAVAIGGAVGSVVRFLTWHYSVAWWGMTFPWGTFIVNIFGSLWLGFFGGLAVDKPGVLDPNVKFLLTSGFAGGLTTWSSLAFETLALYQRGDTALALINIAANVVVGMIAVFLGATIARSI